MKKRHLVVDIAKGEKDVNAFMVFEYEPASLKKIAGRDVQFGGTVDVIAEGSFKCTPEELDSHIKALSEKHSVDTIAKG